MNFFYPGLKLEDTESGIKNKLTGLLSELRGFKFMTALVLEFEKTEMDDKTPLIWIQKWKNH